VVISELASMAPTSGGQYHWCAMLAPPKYMKILSYLTGA
jgi:amino acid transporter